MADVAVPGARHVRASLDTEGAESIVVACPPHPRQRGHRGDPRLTTVGGALADRGVACLRFDYGEWDEGYGEREDARNAIRWAAERYDRVGLFGYSFGAAVALLAAASVDGPLSGVSILAPAARLSDDDDLDAAGAVTQLEVPLQVLYGARDTTVDWEPVVEAARTAGASVEELPSDHFFLGKHERIGESVADFLVGHL